MEEECIICFEVMDEKNTFFKFACSHSEIMHERCIAKLDKCPLCRCENIVPDNRICVSCQITQREYLIITTCLFMMTVLLYSLSLNIIYHYKGSFNLSNVTVVDIM